jgi:hypothetical protein
MSSPSREHLLGYLLGALERTELEQVEAELAHNPKLRDELRRLERCVGAVGLAEDPQAFDPPPGLALATCQYVRLHADQVLRPAGSIWELNHRRLTLADVITAAAIMLAAVTLFLPALSHSRFQSQIASCQNHLRQIGMALHEFSDLQPDGSYPAIEGEGSRSVAGVYAPTLVGNRLVDDQRVFGCPTSPRANAGRALHVPTPEELSALEGQALAMAQQTMGGDYGYNMGYTENGNLVTPSNARRSDYALLADAPSDDQPGRRSPNHGGVGQNVLYEDGHAQFLRGQPWPRTIDDPFHNLAGEVAAGLSATDHVLGASGDRPLPVRAIPVRALRNR